MPPPAFNFYSTGPFSPFSVEFSPKGPWLVLWENIMDIHSGKTMLTFIDSSKNYKLYDEENRVVETKRGEELYSHYDKVEASVREKYEKTQTKETTKTKTVQQKTTTTVKKR